jgi:hypothetical protein
VETSRWRITRALYRLRGMNSAAKIAEGLTSEERWAILALDGAMLAAVLRLKERRLIDHRGDVTDMGAAVTAAIMADRRRITP